MKQSSNTSSSPNLVAVLNEQWAGAGVWGFEIGMVVTGNTPGTMRVTGERERGESGAVAFLFAGRAGDGDDGGLA